MTTHPLHLPRRSFEATPAPRSPTAAPVSASPARTIFVDRVAALRQRLALGAMVLGFSIGAAAIGYAAGLLPW